MCHFALVLHVVDGDNGLCIFLYFLEQRALLAELTLQTAAEEVPV